VLKPPAPRTAAQIELDKAKDLLKKKKMDLVLKSLDKAEEEEGATPEVKNQIRVVRADALLSGRHPDEVRARELILRVLHDDPEGKHFNEASDAVNGLVNEIRETHPLVLHEVRPVSRAGRPLKIRVRANDPQGVIANIVLHFRGHDIGGYSDAIMDKSPTGWSFLLRSPESLAPDGVTDNYVIDYFFTAKNSKGEVVDSDGAPDDPIMITLSTTAATKTETAAGVDLNAVTEAENRPPPEPVVVHVTPWYLKWYTFTAEGVVVAGIVTAVVLGSMHPRAKVPDNLGTLKFPVMP
jgi:hypothetical protein